MKLKWDTKSPKPFQEPTQLDECLEWMEVFLKAHPDGVRVKDVLEAAGQEGFGQAMVYRARKALAGHILNSEGRRSPKNCWKWSEVALSDVEEDEE